MHRTRTSLRSLRILAGLVALAASVTAQALSPPVVKILERDQILGNAPVDVFLKIMVINRGAWYADLNTMHETDDRMVVLNGFPVIFKGASLASPRGAQLGVPADMDINNQGYFGWPLSMTGVLNSENKGVYWNTINLAQKGKNIFATEFDGRSFGANTVYDNFFVVKINDSNSLLVSAKIDDPSLQGTKKENALLILRTDGMGNVTSEEFLLLQRVNVPGTNETFNTLGDFRDQLAFNDNEDWIAIIDLGTDKAVDTAVMINHEIVLREGDPTPGLADRFLLDMDLGARVDINAFGDWVGRFSDDGPNIDNLFILVNGEIYVQEADIVPQLAPLVLQGFDTAPVRICDNGAIYWYGRVNDASGQQRVYFRNKKIIVQEGITAVTGGTLPGPTVLAGLVATEYAFEVSDSGRFWLGWADVTPSKVGLLLGDWGALVPMPGAGCPNNPATLTHISGEAQIGSTVVFEMDGPAALGARPFLYWSLGRAAAGNPCGLTIPEGQLLIDPGRMLPPRKGPLHTPGVPTTFTINLPADPLLVDRKFFGQGYYRDSTTGALMLSDGYSMEIGAP